MLALAQGNYGGSAGRPSGQLINERNQLNNESGQQKEMKADDPTDQNHRDAINGLINEHPAERAKEQLCAVRRQGDGQRDDDSLAGQGPGAEPGN